LPQIALSGLVIIPSNLVGVAIASNDLISGEDDDATSLEEFYDFVPSQ
jgi:hypothetical protein